MIRSRSAKCLLLFASVLLTRAASAQGLQGLDDLLPQGAQQQTLSAEKAGAQSSEVMVPQVATTTAPGGRMRSSTGRLREDVAWLERPAAVAALARITERDLLEAHPVVPGGPRNV